MWLLWLHVKFKYLSLIEPHIHVYEKSVHQQKKVHLRINHDTLYQNLLCWLITNLEGLCIYTWTAIITHPPFPQITGLHTYLALSVWQFNSWFVWWNLQTSAKQIRALNSIPWLHFYQTVVQQWDAQLKVSIHIHLSS